jgi:transcription termination/antitermination protein NusG
MDELNMANGQPVTQLPPEAERGQPEAPPAQPMAAEAGSAEAAPLLVAPPVAEQLPPPEPAAEQPVTAGETEAVQAKVAAEPTEVAKPQAAKPTKQPPAEPKPEEPKAEESKSDKMDWYILKVQSNREESIREGLLRRVAIAGLGFYFSEIIVPTEKVTEFKGGKKKVIKRKLYPGYLVVHMEINDDTWFLVRETPGIGDFTGAAGRPSPMLPHEVDRIVAKQEEKSEKAPRLKIAFREGERVKIKEGTFENFEGDVESIDETNGRVTVMINIFGRSTPVELEYWQIEAL